MAFVESNIKSSKLCLNYGMHFDVTNVTKKIIYDI